MYPLTVATSARTLVHFLPSCGRRSPQPHPQLVVAASPELADDSDAFERKLYVIRRVAEHAAGPELVVPSFSARTLVYKGMLTAPQIGLYYPDLADESFASAMALVHSRFSTNT